MMMFESGKPVLCEKPMTTSTKNVTAMIKAAKEKDNFLMEVHCIHSLRHLGTSPVLMQINLIKLNVSRACVVEECNDCPYTGTSKTKFSGISGI